MSGLPSVGDIISLSDLQPIYVFIIEVVIIITSHDTKLSAIVEQS